MSENQETFALPVTDDSTDIEMAANLVMNEQLLEGAENVDYNFGKFVPVPQRDGSTQYVWTNRRMRRMRMSDDPRYTKKYRTRDERYTRKAIQDHSRKVNFK